MENETICALVRRMENNFTNGTTQLSQYVSFNICDTLNRIDAYLNSVHISGSQDSLGRDKPFFNIGTAAVNVWYRATDLDRKDIRIRATKQRDQVKAFLATVHIRDWMRKSMFGRFLNQWGRTLSQYGSAITKFVEKDGMLIAEVVPWNRIVCDAIDFKNNPKIERLYYTPAQLRNSGYDADVVEKLIESAHSTRKTTDGQQKDNVSEYIEVYEVHGEFPLSYITDDDKDDDTYKQQMHVISFIENENKNEYEDFTLYKGIEKKDPYLITHLIEEQGRTLAIGAIESLFDPQWMVNHSMKQMKDTLDIASKLIFQTADAFYLGRNVIDQIETGDILIHKENMPLNRLANDKPDITAMQNFASQWRLISQEISSTPDAVRGNTLPSGTPYSLGAYLGGQAGSLFEQMTENKGLHIEEMMRLHIIPYIKTKLNNKDEIAATLEDHNITQIDSIYIPNEAIKRFNERTTKDIFKNIETLTSGGMPEAPQPFNKQAEESSVQQGMVQQGNTRYFTPDELGKLSWSEYFKDFEWDCEVEVTNETVDKAATLQTLASVLQTAVNDPEMFKFIMGKIMDETNIASPIEVRTLQAQVPSQRLDLPAPKVGG